MEIKIDLSRPETLPPEGAHIKIIRGWPWNDRLGFMKRNQWGKPIFYIDEVSGDPTRIMTPKAWKPEGDPE